MKYCKVHTSGTREGKRWKEREYEGGYEAIDRRASGVDVGPSDEGKATPRIGIRGSDPLEFIGEYNVLCASRPGLR